MTVLHSVICRIKAFLHVYLREQRLYVPSIVGLPVTPDMFVKVSMAGITGVLLFPVAERVPPRPDDREEDESVALVPQPLRDLATTDQVYWDIVLLIVPRGGVFEVRRLRVRHQVRPVALSIPTPVVLVGHEARV